MVYEFEGRTEKEAIDRAAEELGLEKDRFDVEILESQRGGLFKKGYVKIRIHTDSPVATKKAAVVTANLPPEKAAVPDQDGERTGEPDRVSRAVFGDTEADVAFEKTLIGFLEELVSHMGIAGTVRVQFREERKLGLKIEAKHSSILIGKKGRTLDSLQFLVNVYSGRQGREDLRIIVDCENYRLHREEALVRLAYTVADRVRAKRSSILLEPMNPFDRRLIHTTLSDIADIETKSEGDGLYKQVRVYYRGGKM